MHRYVSGCACVGIVNRIRWVFRVAEWFGEERRRGESSGGTIELFIHRSTAHFYYSHDSRFFPTRITKRGRFMTST